MYIQALFLWHSTLLDNRSLRAWFVHQHQQSVHPGTKCAAHASAQWRGSLFVSYHPKIVEPLYSAHPTSRVCPTILLSFFLFAVYSSWTRRRRIQDSRPGLTHGKT